GLLVDRLQPHHPHQPPHPLAIHLKAVAPKHRRHPARPIKRCRQIQLVHPPHHREVVGAHRTWPVIQCRARHPQQPALRHDRQRRLRRVDQCQPRGRTHGPDLLRKKSRSTVNWPIFSNNGAISASFAAASSLPFAWPRANSDAIPSSSVFFQAWIWLACTPNRPDSSATVPSSRTAASATFALKSAPCLFRVFAMSHLRPTGHSKARHSLSHLSSFRGPPHIVRLPLVHLLLHAPAALDRVGHVLIEFPISRLIGWVEDLEECTEVAGLGETVFRP